ncbi:hypothetical protein BaRGS_00000227 [Batillaria attramentaria]|uniref:Uncharacterized protein n=1 Tax=Batillaria attramentaria TaxID=370345 RepID=A0ABD0MBY4_9CAEN
MASPAMCCVDVSQENELDHSSSLVTSDMSGLLDTDEKPDELNASFDFSEDSCRFEPECILSCPNMACSISEEQTPQPGDVDVVRSLCTATSTSPVASVSSRYGVRLTGDLGATSRVNVCTDTSLRPSSTVVFTSPSTSVLVDDSVSQDETSSQAVSHSASQTHPVVIGNDGAASFVRNVLKDLKPTSSLDSLPGNVKDGITVPAGYVLLSKPTIVPGLVSMVQSGPGTVAAPVIIQLASDVVSTPPASTLQAPSVVGGTMTNTLTVPAHSPTLPFFHRIQSGSIRGGTGTVFDTGSREHARQAVVIGCVNPSVRTGKGMQQILNHFLQQNNQPGQSQSLTSSLEPHSGDQQTYIDVSEITPTTVGSVSQTETCLNTHGESQQTESKRKNVLGSKQQITQTRGKNMPRSSKRVAHASGLTATGTSHLHSSSKDLLRDSMIFPDWSEFPVQGNNPLVLIVKEVHCHQNNMQCDATETLATYTTSSQSTKSAGKHVSASGHMDVDQHAGNDMSEEPAEDEVDGTSTVCSSLSLLKDDCHVQHCANSAQHVSCANSAPHASCANSAPHASGANSAPHASGANSAPHVSSPYSAPHVSCAIGSVPLSVLSSSQSASKDAHDAVTESGVWMANTETDSFFSISQGTDALTRPGDGAEGIRTETSKEALSKGVIRPIIICIVQEDGSTRQVNIYPAESEAEDGRCKPSSDFHITADTESTPGKSHG